MCGGVSRDRVFERDGAGDRQSQRLSRTRLSEFVEVVCIVPGDHHLIRAGQGASDELGGRRDHVDADLLRTALLQGIRDARDVSEPLAVVLRVLVEFDWEGLGPRESQRRRDAMITSNPELLERELNKQQQISDAFGEALRQRGVEPHAAELAARVGIQVFQTAYRRWLAADDETDLATIADASTSTLAAIMPAVTRRT